MMFSRLKNCAVLLALFALTTSDQISNEKPLSHSNGGKAEEFLKLHRQKENQKNLFSQFDSKSQLDLLALGNQELTELNDQPDGGQTGEEREAENGVVEGDNNLRDVGSKPMKDKFRCIGGSGGRGALAAALLANGGTLPTGLLNPATGAVIPAGAAPGDSSDS